MPAELLFFVAGIPAPQGSKSFKGMRGTKDGRQIAIMVESSKKVAPWRQRVQNAVMRLEIPEPFRGAVSLDVEFLLPKPKYLAGKHRPCVTYPDLSKLVRSTEDAIGKAGAWGDDALVVELVARKRYVDEGEEPGALIRVYDPFPEFTKPATKGGNHGKAETQPGRGRKQPGRGRVDRKRKPFDDRMPI